MPSNRVQQKQYGLLFANMRVDLVGYCRTCNLVTMLSSHSTSHKTGNDQQLKTLLTLMMGVKTQKNCYSSISMIWINAFVATKPMEVMRLPYIQCWGQGDLPAIHQLQSGIWLSKWCLMMCGIMVIHDTCASIHCCINEHIRNDHYECYNSLQHNMR